MIYSLSLSQVAAGLGLAWLAGHAWAALDEVRARAWLLRAPRNLVLGWVLLALAASWFALLLGTMDLMEYTPHRMKFVLAVLGIAGLCAHFMREFLAVRAGGALLLLLAQVLLDAAFLRDEPSRLVVTVMAYGFVVAGMAMVGAPYLLRDLLERVCADAGRFRVAAWAGAAWGVVLLGLGLFVY